MTTPKPCPFCGSTHVGVGGAEHERFVHCGGCQAEGPWSDYSKEQAIEAWNRAIRPETRPPGWPIEHAQEARRRARRVRDRRRRK